MQTRQSVNAYSLLAAATLLASKSFRPETPSNWDGDRSGSARIISIPFGKGRSLAFDDVPAYGVKTDLHFYHFSSDISQVQSATPWTASEHVM